MKDDRSLIPTPSAVPDPESRARLVREMFAQIAPRYDLANRLLSASADVWWRKRTVRALQSALRESGARALDIACGTGDLSLELARVCRTFGCDFCHPMLVIAKKKISAVHRPVEVAEADALMLPFASERFDVATIAFGVRNLVDIPAGLREIYRVLKRGGRAAILEFSRPSNALAGPLFLLYFKRVLPLLGRLITGSRYAYQYLPDSVAEFPGPDQLRALMIGAGFSDVTFTELTGGIATLHIGKK